MTKTLPILYSNANCVPCLEVADFIGQHNLAVEARAVLPRMDVNTCERYHVIVASGARVDHLAGVPTLVDGTVVVQGSTPIIAYLTKKYKVPY
jgi:hypothetical protein